MTITYNDIKPLLDDNKSAAEIAATFQANPVTHQPIELGELLFVLNNRGMLTRLIRPADTGEKWAGTIVNMYMYVNDNVPAMAPGVNMWFSHITNDRNSTFDTTDVIFAGQLKALSEAFSDQPNMPTQEDFDAIFELGGGKRYADVTTESVQQVIDEHEAANAAATRQQIIQTAQAAEQARYEAAVKPPRTRYNNAAAALSVFDVANATEEETQAYADKILASEDGRDPDAPAPAPEEVI